MRPLVLAVLLGAAAIAAAPAAARAQAADSAAARDARLEAVGFYARQKKGNGSFLGPEQVRKRHARRVTELLRVMAGVHVLPVPPDQGTGDMAVMRGGTSMSTQGICLPSIVVDGQVVRQGGYGGVSVLVDDLLSPDEVAAVEAYPSSSGLPPRLSGSTSPCGTILFWTRERN